MEKENQDSGGTQEKSDSAKLQGPSESNSVRGEFQEAENFSFSIISLFDLTKL